MSEDQPTLQRRQTLKRYFRALEDGDLAALAAILHQAERDAALERALLALNDLYLDEAVSSAEGNAAWIQVEHALQAQQLSQDSQGRIDSEQEGSRSTMARFAGMNSNKNTESKQQALAQINISETPDNLTPAYVSADGGSPHGQSVAALLRSLVAVAIVGLVLVGFLAVMTTRQSGGQGDSGSLTRTSVKATGNIILVGSNGEITALRASDGAVIWQRKVMMSTHITAPENIVTSIQVQNGVAYFTLEGGDVFAVHASDGSLIWRKSFSPTSTLFVSDGLVVIDSSKGTQALRASDGGELWTLKSVIPIGVAHDIVFVEHPGTGLSLDAIGGTSGKTLWTYDKGSGNDVSVSADSTTVYAFTSGNEPDNTPPYVVALRLSDGSLLWRQVSPYNDSLYPTFTIGDQFIYLQVYGFHYICTFRRADGAKVSCTGDLGRGGTLAIINGTAYISRNEVIGQNQAAQVGTLDAAHGVVQWLWQTPATVYGYGYVHFQGDMVVAVGTTGVSAFRLSDGQQLWHALGNEEFVGSLTTATLP